MKNSNAVVKLPLCAGCFVLFCYFLLWTCWICVIKRDIRQTFRSASSKMRRAVTSGGDILQHTLGDVFTLCPHNTPFVGPYSYTPLSRSPCWQDGDQFRCVPNFYIAGFSKRGVSDLYRRLSQHQDVISGIKAPHWFDFWRNIAGYDTIETYSKSFQNASAMVTHDIVDLGHSNKLIGDVTPCTVWSSLYWRCYQGNTGQVMEPVYTNADVIHRLNPQAKIIFIMGDPVDRLYSQYHRWFSSGSHTVPMEPSREKFHQLVTRAVAAYRRCFCQRSLRSCAYNGTLLADVMLGLQEGMYSVFLHDWLTVFPRNQLFFIKLEDYAVDIATGLQTTVEFLGLADPGILWYAETSGQPMTIGGNSSLGPMLPETRVVLREFYNSVNLHLPNLLGDARFRW
ncbi:hypothetical protein RRG08_061274 [Elysia crispata]|uniref:Sulfotransferase domain-containing protein n=1 Tax=Elysia crispata TaxID=231223 RepID=A0AAE0ZGB4_9GAST|nr:hypothetical protein RRG08_061274 [Elysia crispata]